MNLPREATVQDVNEIYANAWLYGLKGITIYRSGCQREGILTTGSNEEKKDTNKKESHSYTPARGDILVADDNVVGLKRKITTGCGSLFVQAFFDPATGALQETFFTKGGQGGCNQFMIGLSRMISLCARAGVGIEDIIDQLSSCGVCPSYATRTATKHDTSPGSCCPMAIGRALLDMNNQFVDWMDNNDGKIPKVEKEKRKAKINKCPQCGEELVQEGGCICCKACGWSKCD